MCLFANPCSPSTLLRHPSSERSSRIRGGYVNVAYSI
jgi:hypothetical protein